MTYLKSYGNEEIYHYHGDKVRILLLVSVALAFIAIPLWGHLMPFGTVFEVISGIAAITLAGLTNPHSRWIMTLNVIATAVGAFLLELSAISFRTNDSLALMLMREVSAIVLIIALYYSVKTLRAMAQGKIGAMPRPWEFDEPAESNEAK